MISIVTLHMILVGLLAEYDSSPEKYATAQMLEIIAMVCVSLFVGDILLKWIDDFWGFFQDRCISSIHLTFREQP